jgi:hypothetical protein
MARLKKKPAKTTRKRPKDNPTSSPLKKLQDFGFKSKEQIINVFRNELKNSDYLIGNNAKMKIERTIAPSWLKKHLGSQVTMTGKARAGSLLATCTLDELRGAGVTEAAFE